MYKFSEGAVARDPPRHLKYGASCSDSRPITNKAAANLIIILAIGLASAPVMGKDLGLFLI